MNNIKVIIFDFDDTLYRGNDWTYWSTYIEDFLTGVFNNREKAKEFMTRNQIDHKTNGQKIASDMIKEFGSAEPFVVFQEENIYPLSLDKITHINNVDLKKLCKNHSLYIVSNNTVRYMKHYLGLWGIDEAIFSGIYQNNFLAENASKAINYRMILDREGILPDEAIVIGDNYENDIKPALELGINGKWIESLEAVQEIINELNEKN